MSATILALVTDAFGGRGGIAQYNRDFLSALASAGYVVVTIPRHAPDAVEPPAGVIQCAPRPSRTRYSLAALIQAWRRKPDIVFCGHVYMAPLAWLMTKLVGANLVIQMHGIEAWPRPSRLVRWACEQAAMILSVSRYTRARVLDWAVIPPERAMVLPNTVAECFTPGDGAAVRDAWGLNGKKVLLTVGRMSASERYKGQDKVIAVLPELVAAGHDAIYVVAGVGDDRPRLERLAIETGVADRIRFVGALPREQLIEAYRMADLFVMPSTSEGFGIAFLEAMACGTPALGLDMAGAVDALEGRKLGHSCSEAHLAEHVCELLDGLTPKPNLVGAHIAGPFGMDAYRRQVRATFAPAITIT